MPQNVDTVDGQRLLGDKAGGLHLVLDSLAGQPGRAGGVKAGIHGGYLDSGRSDA